MHIHEVTLFFFLNAMIILGRREDCNSLTFELVSIAMYFLPEAVNCLGEKTLYSPIVPVVECSNPVLQSRNALC